MVTDKWCLNSHLNCALRVLSLICKQKSVIRGLNWALLFECKSVLHAGEAMDISIDPKLTS